MTERHSVMFTLHWQRLGCLDNIMTASSEYFLPVINTLLRGGSTNSA